jgi:hypothetical protein
LIPTPALVVPKTRILSGAGYLFKAPVGTALPGENPATVTNKALTTNVVTLTTSAAHGYTTGDTVIVALSPADPVFDGTYTLTAASGSSLSYARTNANVTSTASGGTVKKPAGGTVVGSVFTDAWPAAWIPIGVTKEGHEWSWSPDTENIEVAEYLLPVRIVTTGVEGKVSFEIAEYTGKNIAFALNGGSVTTVSGATTTLLSKISPPVVGQETRVMIGWESEDFTERAVFYQCFQTGEVTVAHKKGADNATIQVEFSLEQPATGNAFDRWVAGTVAVGS